MSRSRRRNRMPAFRLLLVSALLALPAGAQIPDTYSNLQVLPENIAKRDLIEVMRGFTRALGVRCLHCHVGAKEDTLEDYDFATDEKPPKVVAREMMKMVTEINGRLLPAATGREETTEIRCFSCHHGLERPAILEDELLARALEDGVDAAVERYRELRDEHFGSAAYDFRGGALNTVAETLFRAHGDLDGALTLVRLNLEFNPRDTYSLIMLAQGQARQGDRAAAIESLEKAHAVEPENEYVRVTLEQLREMSAADEAVGEGER